MYNLIIKKEVKLMSNQGIKSYGTYLNASISDG